VNYTQRVNKKTYTITRSDSSQIFLGVIASLASATIAALAGYAFFLVLFMTIFLEAGLSGDLHTVFWARIFWALLFAIPTLFYLAVLSAIHLSYRDRFPVFVRALWWTTGLLIVLPPLGYLFWNYILV
jgi:hypothetical protein